MSGFKAFLLKTNALALAVGVIIGVALGNVVTSLVNDIIMPPIGMALGNVDFSQLTIVLKSSTDPTKEVAIRYGAFINVVITFLIVAFVVYVAARWAWRRRSGFTAADGSTRSVLSSEGGKLTARPLFWGSLNSLFGPILAVTGTVWAQQTMNAGMVQSIVAIAPMISVPFAFWLEGHKPPRIWYLGAAVAILGLVLVDLNS